MSSTAQGIHELAWTTHATVCGRCRDVSLSESATFANTCLEGAELLKRYLGERARRRRERDDTAMGGGSR